MSEKICEECGKPISVCNAIAMLDRDVREALTAQTTNSTNYVSRSRKEIEISGIFDPKMIAEYLVEQGWERRDD